MATETSICNRALRLLGAERINSIDDDNKLARLCRDIFDDMRDECIAKHRWNFSLVRVDLGGANSTGPAWGFTYSFNLPADFIRLWETDLDDIAGGGRYRIEGKTLVSDETTVKITYARRVTTAGDFSPGFAETLAYKMAAELAIPILRSVEKARLLREEARNVGAENASIESQQNDVELVEHGLMDAARLQGTEIPRTSATPITL